MKKYSVWVILSLVFVGCKENNHSTNDRRKVEEKKNVAKTDTGIILLDNNFQKIPAPITNPDLNIIEDVANYCFNKKFSDIQEDSILNKNFKIKKGTEEYDDVYWSSYNLYKSGVLVFKLENNAEEKEIISRITFFKNIHTRENVSAGDSFEKIKDKIDMNNLNSGQDGTLVFIDKKNDKLSYLFFVNSKSPFFYGVNRKGLIPGNIPIDEIVVRR